ncbi:hypothetical protein BT69DRAFT_1329166 [Atractiella rhizophila]|nr:hypothetical protein BT69DRAFT_1329166 [Atractiella rhizophila]
MSTINARIPSLNKLVNWLQHAHPPSNKTSSLTLRLGKGILSLLLLLLLTALLTFLSPLPSSLPSFSSPSHDSHISISTDLDTSYTPPPPHYDLNEYGHTERCLGSEATEKDINRLFQQGGEGTVVNLCRRAVIQLGGAVVFTASRQTLQTIGGPTTTGDDRALLNLTTTTPPSSDSKIEPTTSTTAISTHSCLACHSILLLSLRVFGGRDVLPLPPKKSYPPALLELGNWSANLTVKGCKDGGCTGAKILDNEIGPCGVTWNTGPIGDGISFQCVDGLVANNTIVDATDGGIVVFGAPGTRIVNNTISNVNQHGLGGINMVDYIGVNSSIHSIPRGSFEGVVVEGNTIIAEEKQIKIGIAMGSPPWGDNLNTPLYGATVRNNLFKGRNMLFGLALAGVHHWSVYGNRVLPSARFRGVRSGEDSIDPCHDLVDVEPTFAIVDLEKLGDGVRFGPDGNDGVGMGEMDVVQPGAVAVGMGMPPVMPASQGMEGGDGEKECWKKASFQFLLCYNPDNSTNEGTPPEIEWIEGGPGCRLSTEHEYDNASTVIAIGESEDVYGAGGGVRVQPLRALEVERSSGASSVDLRLPSFIPILFMSTFWWSLLLLLSAEMS